MRPGPTSAIVAALLMLTSPPAARSAEPAKEADYYKILTFAIPEGIILEAGALEMMPDGRLAVATRRGEIYMVSNPLSPDPAKESTFSPFAKGLHEVLGLAQRDGWLYVTQRGELSRIRDSDGDGRADVFETVTDAWEIGGDYHEYAFGSKFDRDSNLWVALCLTGSFTSENKFRGWALRVSPDGKVMPTTGGLRSPGGLGMNADGDMFYTENQGPWNGACALKHLEPGAFVGHPAGLKWWDESFGLGARPEEPASGGRLIDEADRIAKLRPPAVYFPYPQMGQSASGIGCDASGGKFGPFAGQLFVGDQSASTVMRVALEKVDGRYQGACFPFREGFASGNLPFLFAPDGSLIVGGTNRGWGSKGNREFALERLVWTGATPFEVRTMSARPDGFELTFTEAADSASVGDPKSYSMKAFTYIYQLNYGSPEVDASIPTVTRVEVGPDNRSARLYVDGLKRGHIHELRLPGVRSAEGKAPLLHDRAYYTLNSIPKAAAP